MTTPDVTLMINPTEFFREKVASALDSQNLKVSDDIEYYLVNLLCEFIAPHKVCTVVGKMDLLDTPLAIVLKAALESPPEEQLKIYKVLGDTSLYISGYFQDFFNRKSFDVDYYIALGSNAYNHVAALARDRHRERHNSGVYDHLAQKFPQYVEVVAEVADILGTSQSSNLLAIYDRWTRNQSDRLRRKLESSGINPVQTNMKLKQ